MKDAEKQIEEMQFIMLNAIDLRYLTIESVKKNYDGSGDKRFLAEANALYTKGCRIQQEARWIPVSTKPGVHAGMKCSLCKAKISYKDFYSGNHNYCYKCGAKMIKEDIHE